MSARTLDKPIVMSATGMLSAVGDSTLQTFTSVRAGINRFQEMPELYHTLPDDPDFEDGEPLVASSLYYLAEQRKQKDDPAEWLAHIAGCAFSEMRAGAHLELSDFSGMGLFLALPQERSGWDESRQERFLYHFHNEIALDPFSLNRFSYAGHAGALSLLGQACELLAQGELKYALVGGTDSYLFRPWLASLDQDYRIKSSRSPAGFAPGEAAGFLLLEPDGQPQKRNTPVQARIKGYGSGKTAAALPGLDMSLPETLSPLLDRESPPPVIICNLNGETGRMKEWGYAVTRLGTKLGAPVLLEHPAASYGDIGAASGAVLAGLAPHLLARKHQGSTSAVVWTASDNGEKSAVLMSVP